MDVKLNKKMNALVCALGLISLSFQVSAQQTWSYTYHPTNGQIETADGPRTDVNDVMTYSYDASGNVSDMTNALGQVTQYPSYDASGRVLQMIDANGVVTDYAYTVRGWLESITVRAPIGNSSGDAITVFTYDAVGQVTRVDLPGTPSFAINYEYDGARRLTSIYTDDGDRITYTLDAAGNRLSETITDSNAITYKTLTRAYDELSRVMQITGADNQVTDLQYDVNNNLTTTINGRQFPTTQSHDPLNRVQDVEDAKQGTITYTYDGQDNLRTVTDQRGNTTTYDYDGFGNLLQIASPDTGITTFTYDEANNLTSQTDARGIVTDYSYDALNRLTQITYPADPAQNISYIYDDPTAYGVGRLTEVQDPSGTTRYRYDHRGNVIETRVVYINGPVISPEIITHYVYDSGDNMIETHYPSGRIVTKALDQQQRVASVSTQTTVSDPSLFIVNAINYIPFGPATSWDLANNLQQVNAYDQDYRLTDLTVNDAGGAQSPAAISLTYTYDAVNNIEDITDNSGQGVPKFLDYAYDELDRLTDFTSPAFSSQYTYDPVGNRLTLITTDANGTEQLNYNYDALSNRLLDVISDSGEVRIFNYDANGNITFDDRGNDNGFNFTFNARNRLEQATSEGAE